MPNLPSRGAHWVAPCQKQDVYLFLSKRGTQGVQTWLVQGRHAHNCRWQLAGSSQLGQCLRKVPTCRAESQLQVENGGVKEKVHYKDVASIKGLEPLCLCKSSLAYNVIILMVPKQALKKTNFSFEVNETQSCPVHAVPLLLLLFQGSSLEGQSASNCSCLAHDDFFLLQVAN